MTRVRDNQDEKEVSGLSGAGVDDPWRTPPADRDRTACRLWVPGIGPFEPALSLLGGEMAAGAPVGTLGIRADATMD